MGALLVAGVAASQALLVQVGIEDGLKHVPVLGVLGKQRLRRAGSPWGIVLTARRVPAPHQLEGREQVVAHTRAWVAALEPLLAEHAEDWHMLQPVFDADLDQERLARSHARDQQGAHEENA